MAVTKIWPIHGQLKHAVKYVENEEKTDSGKHPEIRQAAEDSLNAALNYISQDKKTRTEHHIFVSGINCDPATAIDEMNSNVPRYQKEKAAVAYHAYQSFAPGEITPELAHQIGVQLATELWGNRFQVVVATHLDKSSHIHNHFVICAVSFKDGKRFVDNLHTYTELRDASDRLCREYGLSVLPQKEWGSGKQRAEWQAEQDGKPTWRNIVKKDVDEAIRTSPTMEEFYRSLQRRGYSIKVGADISVRPPGKERFLRLKRNFGESYSAEQIQQRLGQFRYIPMTEIPRRYAYYPQKNPFRLHKHGIQGLYLHYCFLLGIFQEKPVPCKQMPFALKEDLLKLEQYSFRAQILGDHHISSHEELNAYRQQMESKKIELAEERKVLRAQLKHLPDSMEKTGLRQRVKYLTEELRETKQRIAACDGIEADWDALEEKVKRIDSELYNEHEHNEQSQEVTDHEHQR